MNADAARIRLARAGCLTLWLLVIALPLLVLTVAAVSSPAQPELVRPVFASLLRTCLLAGIVAAAAVVLGWAPGRLLGTSGSHSAVLLLLLLMPLLLPHYVLYYAWTLLLSPTTQLGRILASEPALARLVGSVTSTGVLIGWYWPLAALVLAQGWRGIDSRVWDSALLEATGPQRWRHVTIPLLSRSLLLAFGTCFVLSVSEFAAFHLAGVRTIGTELAVLYELTGAVGPVARAAWPVALIALPAAVALTRTSRGWVPTTVSLRPPAQKSTAVGWTVLVLLLAFFWAVPVALLIANVTTLQPFRQFLLLHADDLSWSLLTAGVAALLACLTALGGLLDTDTENPGRRVLPVVVRGTVFLAMFLPASLLAVSLLRLLSVVRGVSCVERYAARVPLDALRALPVSMGQASRFAGLALILLLLTRYPDRRRLTEMAALDGASPWRTWWHIHLPRTWPVLAGTFLLVTMFGFTELAATMVLLPAGLPNFAQRLLNQMHYARDQQVIASCLVLVSLFVFLTGVVVLLLRMTRARRSPGRGPQTRNSAFGNPILLLAAVLVCAGCDGHGKGEPRVVDAFGKTGAGPGEFLYPRAIDFAGDGAVVIADKTGRIQRINQTGQCLSVIQMPSIEAGKPTGVSVHEDGRLFVADTHYHRVAIFSPEGKLIDEFGTYGEEGGCFIYPTDVAFAPDGRIFVSEYGGNDRVSVFTADGDFLSCFGSPGTAEGQFSRPQALCIDGSRQRLYVVDACNHRIGVYDLDGHFLRCIGSAGRGPGQLRYPYGLALLADGTLVVCEYGNNRLQLFSPEGKSLGVYGEAGRQLGQLAYPWAVAVDARGRAYVVDAGNNRIQVWQL